MPGRDIEIRFTGLRPGEKLFEELSLGEEETLKTQHPRIFIGKVKAPKLGWISTVVEELGHAAIEHDVSGIYAKLKEIVPEYTCSHHRRDQPVSTTPFTGPHDTNVPTFSS